MKKICVECGKEFDVDETNRKERRKIVCSDKCQKMHGYKIAFNKNKSDYIVEMEKAGMKLEFHQKESGECFWSASGTKDQYMQY